MDFKVKAISKDKFDAWVTAMQDVKEPLKASTAAASEGQEIFNNICIGCHAVTPANKMPDTARIAPNLSNFGDRSRVAGILEHNKENVKKCIENPETYKTGNLMTGKYGNLSDDQIDALADYLMGLKVQE
jgi:cytochrome c oxidase subunit 2